MIIMTKYADVVKYADEVCRRSKVRRRTLKKIAEKCEFPDLEDRLRDALVCGILNEEIQSMLLVNSILTFKVAQEMALAHEAAVKNVAEIKNGKPQEEMNWPEAIIMDHCTATATVRVLRNLFAVHGLPDQVVLDNGRMFVGHEFQEFLMMNGIRHITSAPYHPQTNGQAERVVQTLKQLIRKNGWENISVTLPRALFAMRTTPHGTTGLTPAELLMGRRLTTRMNRLHPKESEDSENGKEHFQNRFKSQENVYARKYNGKGKWEPGKIKTVLGPRIYEVIMENGVTAKRHQDQLMRRVKEEVSEDVEKKEECNTERRGEQMNDPNESQERLEETPGPSRPIRNRRLPEYLKDCVTNWGSDMKSLYVAGGMTLDGTVVFLPTSDVLSTGNASKYSNEFCINETLPQSGGEVTLDGKGEEIPTTRAYIAEARARQMSSAEKHCVYLEHGPELQPFHYLRALDRLLGGTAGVVQVSKVNGHQLLGLANRGLAERLINNGLEVEGTLLRAFPFRKRAERITVSNLPFFVEDSAIIRALGPYGRITSIAPKMMKAGPYTYTDGRREAFIVLHEGVTTERLPTRLDITIKGEAWPAYLSSGIKCSRCHGQGHRRANCPLLAGRTTAPGPATPTSPTSVPPATASRLPQQPSAQPPPPASPSPAMEVSDVPPTSRAALHPPAALRQSPPAPSALPVEDAPPAPPPVTPAPSLRVPGSHGPAAPTPDIEMSIVEETSTSSTSSSRTSTREGLNTFIERNPGVSFTGTDALGLGREEVLDLLSSKTRARKQGPLLSPPQSDALAGLIGQILDLRPRGTSNIYKVLGQVRAELTTTPAAAPTPPLSAPRPAGPTPPAPHGDTTTPAMTTPPPPLSTQMERVLMDKRWKVAGDLIHELSREIDLEHTFQTQVDVDDIVKAILYPGDREPLLKRLPTRDRYILGGFISTAIWRARNFDPFVLENMSALRKLLPD
ncbi:K02A2.6-like [Cordylochernes scorpioides]|uniref:K02A2.6-like n=1 Tax=Cordylochernes scorpioides TaxID=51811 RepID=A0ABY6KU96_9ARAC|nr:K02A2.6-like [Cordylochernes scorpioides]